MWRTAGDGLGKMLLLFGDKGKLVVEGCRKWIIEAAAAVWGGEAGGGGLREVEGRGCCCC